MNIEPGKFYRTRDGRKVRIYATDGQRSCQVHGAVFECGRWDIRDWWINGSYGRQDEADSADIIAEWTEPHPLANAKRGDPIWVRDGDCGGWSLRLFARLEKGDRYPVIASDCSDLSVSAGWFYGKPYIPGEAP